MIHAHILSLVIGLLLMSVKDQMVIQPNLYKIDNTSRLHSLQIFQAQRLECWHEGNKVGYKLGQNEQFEAGWIGLRHKA